MRDLNNNVVDLEKINRNLMENYKPSNIDLTDYEQEQEQSAIISYEELINSKKQDLKYDDRYENKTSINVKKIDLDNEGVGSKVKDSKIENQNNYEKEEEFLKMLKELQINLAR